MHSVFRAAVALLFLTVSAQADERGLPAEARSMAATAAAYLRSHGPEEAFKAFGQPGLPFHDRDLYVLVFDQAGKNVAHGAVPGQVGKNLIDMKDVDGVPIIREMVAIQGAGLVAYKWPNPMSKQVEKKTLFVEQVGNYYVGVGAYSKD